MSLKLNPWIAFSSEPARLAPTEDDSAVFCNVAYCRNHFITEVNGRKLKQNIQGLSILVLSM